MTGQQTQRKIITGWFRGERDLLTRLETTWWTEGSNSHRTSSDVCAHAEVDDTVFIIRTLKRLLTSGSTAFRVCVCVQVKALA